MTNATETAPKRRIFDVTIGKIDTAIYIEPRHLEGDDAEECHDWRTDAIDVKRLAAMRAVRKIFGRHCWWHRDSGVEGFGQVVERGGSTRTNTVRLTVEERS